VAGVLAPDTLQKPASLPILPPIVTTVKAAFTPPKSSKRLLLSQTNCASRPHGKVEKRESHATDTPSLRPTKRRHEYWRPSGLCELVEQLGPLVARDPSPRISAQKPDACESSTRWTKPSRSRRMNLLSSA
jgi:hypothetical protein